MIEIIINENEDNNGLFTRVDLLAIYARYFYS